MCPLDALHNPSSYSKHVLAHISKDPMHSHRHMHIYTSTQACMEEVQH